MRRVGRYELLKVLASGGMGTVYLARVADQGAHGRHVAIKEPHAELLRDLAYREMFLREARITSQIRHPNVVSTVDVLEVDLCVYYVMELVEGDSAGQLLALAKQLGRRVPVGIALRIVLDVLAGLDAVHRAHAPDGAPLRIVHRDVSPQNVLVGMDGIARITDFGIAKTATHHTSRDGGLKGKVRYVAPEQIRGEVVTASADVYSACVLAWELFAGEALFFGSSEAAILARVLSGHIRPLSRHAPEVPAALVEKIEWGLRTDPAQRPASAADLARALMSTGIAASRHDVACFVGEIAGDHIRGRHRGAERLGPGKGAGTAKLSADVLHAALSPAPPPTPSRRPTRREAAVLVAALALASVIGTAAWYTRRRPMEVTPLPPASTATVSSGSPPSPPAEPAPTTAELPSLGASSKRPRPRVEKRPSHGTAAGPPHADCDVPYFVDEQGIRRVRQECL